MAGSGGGLSSPQVAGPTQFGELVPVIVFFVLSLQGSSARNVGQFSGPFGYGGLSVRGGPEFGVGVFGAQCSEAPGGFRRRRGRQLGSGVWFAASGGSAWWTKRDPDTVDSLL